MTRTPSTLSIAPRCWTSVPVRPAELLSYVHFLVTFSLIYISSQRSTYGEDAPAFSSDFQIPHVELVPVAYTLSDSDDEEEEVDREVGKEGEAEGNASENESGALRTGSSARPAQKTQTVPSSMAKSEGALSLPSASTSKPGTIFVKKDGGSSGKAPKTPAKQERPKPRGAYRGAKPSTPPAAKLFDDEARASSSKTTADNRPVYALSSQGRPPSEDVAELAKPPAKVLCFGSLLFHFLIFSVARPCPLSAAFAQVGQNARRGEPPCWREGQARPSPRRFVRFLHSPSVGLYLP
jgi:hypothetical protein